MGTVKTESTAEVIRNMASELKDTGDRLERLADDLENQGDWLAVSEALSLVTGVIPNLRLDLLAARPIREFQYALIEAEKPKLIG